MVDKKLKENLELLKIAIRSAKQYVIVVEDQVAACHSSVWGLCSAVEEIDQLFKEIESEITLNDKE